MQNRNQHSHMYGRPLVHLVGLDDNLVVTCLQYIAHTKEQRVDVSNCDLQYLFQWVQPVLVENAQALHDLHVVGVEPDELQSTPGLASGPRDA